MGYRRAISKVNYANLVGMHRAHLKYENDLIAQIKEQLRLLYQPYDKSDDGQIAEINERLRIARARRNKELLSLVKAWVHRVMGIRPAI